MRLWIPKLISFNAPSCPLRFISETKAQKERKFSLPKVPPCKRMKLAEKVSNLKSKPEKSWEFIWKICKFDIKSEIIHSSEVNVREYLQGKEKSEKIFLMMILRSKKLLRIPLKWSKLIYLVRILFTKWHRIFSFEEMVKTNVKLIVFN